MPGLNARRAGPRLALVVGTLLLAAAARAERPADTQQLDDLNRNSQRQLHAIQRGNEPVSPGPKAMQEQRQQLRLQSSQRNELLRQHYRNRMLGRPRGQVRHEAIVRQRRFQAAQEAQLRRFERLSVRPTGPRRPSAPGPLAPLRR